MTMAVAIVMVVILVTTVGLLLAVLWLSAHHRGWMKGYTAGSADTAKLLSPPTPPDDVG
jgi:hypothetical protein